MSTDEMRDTENQEYVLGLLDAKADARYELRLRQGEATRKQAAGWSLIFASTLVRQTKAVRPPAWLWTRINRQIELEEIEKTPSWIHTWRMAAAFVMMIGLALLIGLTQPKLAVFTAQEQASLALSKSGPPVWRVEGDVKNHRMEVVALRNFPATDDRQPVLWLAAADGQTIAVGKLPRDKGGRLQVRPAWTQGGLSQAKLAVSLEPAHTPIGDKPLGPIVSIVGWQPV